MKAYNLLKEREVLNNVSIYLEKNTGYGAGLGSGSSNAAFTLKFLNSFWNLNLSREKILSLSEKIGSDVSFFIENRPAIIEGKGSVTKILNYNKLYIIILKPKNVTINTGWAYKKVFENKLYSDNIATRDDFIKYYLNNNLEKMCENMFNTFELLELDSLIKEGKEILYKSGAVRSMLSGSGSSVFGIYRNYNEYKNAINILKNKKIELYFDFYF